MINKLKLQNFKCFEDQEFAFKNLTLLTGLNGTGKSSVIQSFLALKQSYERDLEEIGLSLNGDYVSIGRGKDLLFMDAQEEIISISLETDTSMAGHWTFDYQQDADVLKNASPSQDNASVLMSESLFTDRFQYLGAERIGPRVVYNVSEYQVLQHRRLGIGGQYATQYLAVFGDEPIENEKLHHKSAQNNTLKGQVEAWLSEVTPGTRVIATPHSGMDLVNLQYQFQHGTVVTEPFIATNVGFGLTYTLPVLIALLSAKKNDLLIIENPEAHLHPKGQRKLGELLARVADSGVQIIAESHSDHLLNGIRLAVKNKKASADSVQLYYFESKKDSPQKASTVSSPKLDSNGRIDSWPQGFFDEWDESLEQLLQPT